MTQHKRRRIHADVAGRRGLIQVDCVEVVDEDVAG